MDGPTLEKDRAASSNTVRLNNGYATMLLPTLENRTNKMEAENRSKSPYQGLIKLSQRELGFVLLCAALGGLVFATLPEQVLHTTCTLLKLSSRFLLPGLTSASLFYWSGFASQKYFDSHVSLWIMPVFLTTELLVEVYGYIRNETNHISIYVTVVGILALSIMYAMPESRNEGTCIFALCFLITNLLDRMASGQCRSILRYAFVNLSAFAGEFLTRSAIFPTAKKPAEIEAKVSLSNKNAMKVRRSSSASSTNSNRRRTSLPALGFQAKSSIDPTTLGEAHGMLSDLLADSNLPANVASTLKIISTMIAQPTFGGFARGVNPMSPLVENRFIPDEKVCEQPDMMDDGSRSRPQHLASTSRRKSNLWTTTTSATGMPTVERDNGVPIPNNIACNNIPGSPRSGSPTTFQLPSKSIRQGKSLHQGLSHLQDAVRQNEGRSSPILRKLPSDAGTFKAVKEERTTVDETCKACGCSESHVNSLEEREAVICGRRLAIPVMSFGSKPKPTVEEVLKKSKERSN